MAESKKGHNFAIQGPTEKKNTYTRFKRKVTPMIMFWFSQWKKELMMQIKSVDLKLSKDTKPN